MGLFSPRLKRNPGLPRSYDAPMGAGKKVAIGCGGLLILIVLAFYLGWRWLGNNLGMTMKAEVIAERLNTIAPLTIPEGFEPVFSFYTEPPLKNPMLMYVNSSSRSRETSLVIFQTEGYLSEEELTKEVMEGGSGMQISIGEEAVGEAERFPVTFEGVEYSAKLQEGLGDDQSVERLIMVVIPTEFSTLMIVLSGDPTILHTGMLQSILTPGTVAIPRLTTPPTDAGETLETDQ